MNGKNNTFVLLISIVVIIYASLSTTSLSVKKLRPDDLLNQGVVMTSISLINDNLTVLDKEVIHANGYQQLSSYKKSTALSTTSLTFNYTGTMQSFIVPSGVTYIDVLMWGGGGGSYTNQSANAGYGLLLSANIPIMSGTTCYLYVGGQGMGYDWSHTPNPFMGGFNGGGNGSSAYGYAGGGASDIRIGGTALQNRVVVAGGGGGGDRTGVSCTDGGDAGYVIGGTADSDSHDENYGTCFGGGGGTLTAGGTGGTYYTYTSGDMGSPGQGGACCASGGGGGGGGYYGGGGGCYSGGGGGSSYSQYGGYYYMGNNRGAGQITITYSLSSMAVSFKYTGTFQSFTIPSDIYLISVTLVGAGGGSSGLSHVYYGTGGRGAQLQFNLAVTPGDVYYLFVGGRGKGLLIDGSLIVYAGGYNGGGNGTGPSSYGGGGATDIRFGGTALANRIAVAGGGGGADYTILSSDGGSSGITYASGSSGSSFNSTSPVCTYNAGAGGTSMTGGTAGYVQGHTTTAVSGSLGQGGSGGCLGGSLITATGAGGGGGYYGGGTGCATGGGGGSSYVDSTKTTTVTYASFNHGDGYALIEYVNTAPTLSPTSSQDVLPTVVPDITRSLSPSEVSNVLPFTIPSLDPIVKLSSTQTATSTLDPTSSLSESSSLILNSTSISNSSIISTLVPTIALSNSLSSSAAASLISTEHPTVSSPSVTSSSSPIADPTSSILTIIPNSRSTTKSIISFNLTSNSSVSSMPIIIANSTPAFNQTNEPTSTSTSIPSLNNTTISPTFNPSIIPTLIHSSETSNVSSSIVFQSEYSTITPSMDLNITSSLPTTLLPNIASSIPSTVLPSSTVQTTESTMFPSVSTSSVTSVNLSLTPFKSILPNDIPSLDPTLTPNCSSIVSTDVSTLSPSMTSIDKPSEQPTAFVTSFTSVLSTLHTTVPTSEVAIIDPTMNPAYTSSIPTFTTLNPSNDPSVIQRAAPLLNPSATPSVNESSDSPTSTLSNLFTHPSRESSSYQPSNEAYHLSTTQPSTEPSIKPSYQPTGQPSSIPSRQPTIEPSSQPSSQPSSHPSSQPSSQPSSHPSRQPFCTPSGRPSTQPSIEPSHHPSYQPSSTPTTQPSKQPSFQPSKQPTSIPSHQPSFQPSSHPTQPTGQPTSQPTNPTSQPSIKPSCQPTGHPSSIPSRQPTIEPTSRPSSQPSSQLSSHPSRQPFCTPSGRPSTQPSIEPSHHPSYQPSSTPTTQPSKQPSFQPSKQPTSIPSHQPSFQPSSHPTQPTGQPTSQPTNPTSQPSIKPSLQPSNQPSNDPTSQPSFIPSVQPSLQPSERPTKQPSNYPSTQPTRQPIMRPSSHPSRQPSSRPSAQPSNNPSRLPTRQPSELPSSQPSRQPTSVPTRQPIMRPTTHPSRQPSSRPSAQPSNNPSRQPTRQPSELPSSQPSRQPTSVPTLQPIIRPSSLPSRQPSSRPSAQPSNNPSRQPTRQPSELPSSQPSRQPTSVPTRQPIMRPSTHPSLQPLSRPSAQPSNYPSRQPIRQPSELPSSQPSRQPTSVPTLQPIIRPSSLPSRQPSSRPSAQPLNNPSRHLTRQPSELLTSQASRQPTSVPTRQPIMRPSSLPSRQPSSRPSAQPSNNPSRQPTRQPSELPSSQPLRQPTSVPTRQPIMRPSTHPSRQPSSRPSAQPSSRPSAQPSNNPSRQPTRQPSELPSSQPSRQPTSVPTRQPIMLPSTHPSRQPSSRPSAQPSSRPSAQPSSRPSAQPSNNPSRQPTRQPSELPLSQPSRQPTSVPTCQPIMLPSTHPSRQPSSRPSAQPSNNPSRQPTRQPSELPSSQPSRQPTSVPTRQLIMRPSSHPSRQPSSRPSAQPLSPPSAQPSSSPSAQPSNHPSKQPTRKPSELPSSQPSRHPTSVPTRQPIMRPSSHPSRQPSSRPSAQPLSPPSAQPLSPPSAQPSNYPSKQPTRKPSELPSSQPSRQPTSVPTLQPIMRPSSLPSRQPSSRPSAQPSKYPSRQPTRQPSELPSSQPSRQPTSVPTRQPIMRPSSHPSRQPSSRPSAQPLSPPSAQPLSPPSAQPSNNPSIQLTRQPSELPSSQPSRQPTSVPTLQPIMRPSSLPSRQPSSLVLITSVVPSSSPTNFLTTALIDPIVSYSSVTTRSPSCEPISQPSLIVTINPSSYVLSPTTMPSGETTISPSKTANTEAPSASPSVITSSRPSLFTSSILSTIPSILTTIGPTRVSIASSAVPSMIQSSLPSSAVPTIHSSLKPTTVPSTVQPTPKPGDPTMTPTILPTSVSSSSPSTVPSLLPSSVPSLRPSVPPSISPTLSEVQVMMNQLQTSLGLLSINDTDTAIEHRSTYFELNAYKSSVSSNIVYGGCSAWSSVLYGDMLPSQYTLQPKSLSIQSYSYSSADYLTSKSHSFVNCQDRILVRDILSNILGPVFLNGGIPQITSYNCDNSSWVVRHCPAADKNYYPAICIGCSDPCVSCRNPLAKNIIIISPCMMEACSTINTLPSSVQLLSVGYGALQKAPLLLAFHFRSTMTTITIEAQFSSEGSLYCGLFLSGTAGSLANIAKSITLQNNVAVISQTGHNATIDLQGLEASTAYDVYFLTVSPIGSKMSTDQVLATIHTVSTKCCKKITVGLTINSLMENQVASNALVISLSAKPSASTTLQLKLIIVDGESSSLVAQQFLPSIFTVTSLSPAKIFYSSWPAMSKGLYEFQLISSGDAVDEYSLIYSSTQLLRVLSSGQIPPVPQLTQAVFSYDGSYLTISFDTNTNQGNTMSSFQCSELFEFTCSSVSRCQWMDFSTIRGYIQQLSPGSICAKPGDTLTLSSIASIKAKCQSTSSCSSYLSTQSTSLILKSPITAIAPAISISAPSIIGGCDTVALDISGSSGNGGRDWISSSMTVSSTSSTDIIALQDFIRDNITTLNPPPSIPASLLVKGSTYNFIVSLCNFLGKCNVGSKNVVVINDVVPNVAILGSPSRTIKAKDPLLLSSSAFVSSCDGKKSSAGLLFKWSITSNNVPQLDIQSTSKDPTKYVLPSFSLRSNTFYDIILSVSGSSGGQVSRATIQVYVDMANVVAVINGDTSRSMRVSEQIHIDGSASYDEDQSGVTGSAAGLLYTWSCLQVSPLFKDHCSDVFDNSKLVRSSNSTRYDLFAKTNSMNYHCQITLLITDATLTRSAQAQVLVRIVPKLAPVVGISAPSLLSSRIINSGQQLQLIGSLSVPANAGGNSSWIIDDKSIRLSSIALSPLVETIAPIPSSSDSVFVSRSFFLVIAGNQLPVGSTLVFTLVGMISTKSSGKIQTSSSISVTVNAPPSQGLFYVSPAVGGIELSTAFAFIAIQWVDSELPLSYQFGYTTTNNVSVVLISKVEVSFGSSKLPAGDESNEDLLQCNALVFDSLNAVTNVVFSVEVKMQGAMDSATMNQFVSNSFSDASNTDGIKQAAAFSSYVLNINNCTSAPNCTALNRHKCSSTAHTCGACMASFIGVDGDTNEPCVKPTTGIVGRHLLDAADDLTAKLCPGECSGHGSCEFVYADSGQLFNQDEEICHMGRIDCYAVCNCDEDYFGSDSCDVTTHEFSLKQKSRTLILNGIQTLVNNENPDIAVISSWMNSLQVASQTSSELSIDSCTMILNLADIILNYASSLSSDQLSVILFSINAASEFISKLLLRQKLLQQKQSPTLSSNFTYFVSVLNTTSIMTQQLLQKFGQSVVQKSSPGQHPSEFIQGQFRMNTQMLSDSYGIAENVSISIPQSEYERYLGRKSSSIIMPRRIRGTSQDMVDEGIKVVASTLRSEAFSYLGLSLNSDPVRLQLSSSPCHGSSCVIQVILQNSKPINFYTLNSNVNRRLAGDEYVSISCSQGDYMSYNVSCTDGHTIALHCKGVESIVKQRCPTHEYASTCNALSRDQAIDTSACQVDSYGSGNVSCSCDFTTGNAGDSQSEYSVSYVSMLEATVRSFTSTVETVNTLNVSKVEQGWRALVTLGVLAFSIVIALLWSHFADNQVKKIKPIDEIQAHSIAKNIKSSQQRSLLNRKKRVLINRELEMVENSLPKVLSSRSFSQRVADEVKHHHRWIGVIFYFSEDFPRVLRVVSLATNIIIMLFMQSLTYNFTNPDDGTCQTFQTESSCIQPRSAFSTNDPKCSWTSKTNTCEFIEPDGQIQIILFVAFFCAIVTTPIALTVDWVINRVLSAPTLESSPTSDVEYTTPLTTSDLLVTDDANNDTISASLTDVLNIDRRSKRTNSRSLFSNLLRRRQSIEEDSKLIQYSKLEFQTLARQVKVHRTSLSAEERKEFDVLWGLKPDGDFLSNTNPTKSTSIWSRLASIFKKQDALNVADIVMMDLKQINATVQEELAALKVTHLSKQEIGQRILFLFQCDLLPGVSGKILELKSTRDKSKLKYASWLQKCLGWLFLFALDCGMLFYIFLFALTQTGSRQNAWFQSFAMWIVVEICLVSTAIVFASHIVVPLLVMKDITQIKRRLIEDIREFNDKLNRKTADNQNVDQIDEENEVFNAAKYLFVSTRLAKHYPMLKQSKIISQFSTPWPRQSYHRVDNVSKQYDKKFSAVTKSASFLLMFFVGHFVSMPSCLQDIVIQMSSTAAIGYVLLLHLQLYQIYPALVILPISIIAIVVHFIIESGKSDAKIRLAKLFPVHTSRNHVVIRDESLKVNENEVDHTSEDDRPIDVKTNAGRHQTRRQSIQIGLSFIENAQKNSRNSDSDSAEEDDSISSDNNIHEFDSNCNESINESDEETSNNVDIDSNEGSNISNQIITDTSAHEIINNTNFDSDGDNLFDVIISDGESTSNYDTFTDTVNDKRNNMDKVQVEIDSDHDLSSDKTPSVSVDSAEFVDEMSNVGFDSDEYHVEQQD